jgi:hypothetical protein
VQLRHVREVHPVDRPDQRRSEQNGRPGRDLLEVVDLAALTCGDAAIAVSDVRRCFFQCISFLCRVTQSILPKRSPAGARTPQILPRAAAECGERQQVLRR